MVPLKGWTSLSYLINRSIEDNGREMPQIIRDSVTSDLPRLYSHFAINPSNSNAKLNNIYKLRSQLTENRSQNSSVGIASGYELEDRGVGVRVPVGSGVFSSPRRPDRLWGPPIQWLPGIISSEVKRLGREADHSSPASAEVKKMWIYTSIPP
jgi:hypothetical protein